jgi:hypothetical protein
MEYISKKINEDRIETLRRKVPELRDGNALHEDLTEYQLDAAIPDL